jgi:hypothetical protein
MRTKKIAIAMMMSVGAAGLLAVVAPQEASAIPAFSRQTEKSCSTCHNAVPKLNIVGQNFKTNGFRFPEDGEWLDIQNMKHVPLGAEVEVEGEFNKADVSGSNSNPNQHSKLKIDEIEIQAGAPLGKNGGVSVYGNAQFNPDTSVGIGQTYVQVNDLIGRTGHGLLNVKAGQQDIALPFLSHSQRIIKQRYFAQSALGILGGRAIGTAAGNEAGEFFNTMVELNGQVVGDITHRYSVGAFQPNGLDGFGGSKDSNRLGDPGIYATYAVNFFENFNLGAIFKRDMVNGNPTSGIAHPKEGLNKYGIAGEAKLGPVLVTAGYFNSEAVNSNTLQNYMVEAYFIPDKKFIVGARFDHIDQELFQSGTRTTAMARYNLSSSVYLQGEWRVTDLGTTVTATTPQYGGTDALNGRVYLVAYF